MLCLLHVVLHGMEALVYIDMTRTPYQASEGKHSQQPTMQYHPTLTLSSFHQRTALFLTIAMSIK